MLRRVLPALLVLSFLPLTGCMVSSKKGANGDENVAISTPLGGMSVKTDNTDVQAKIGLPLYPGAVPEKKKNDDSSAADVNMNFGAFHLRVLAMGFTSSDSPEKIEAFYRKALSQYSDVIKCQNKKPIGKPTQTGLGLTCSDDKKVHASVDADDAKDDSDEISLRAGSPSREHIVSYKAHNGGTKFGLVWLELPRDEKIGGKDDSGE